MLVLIILTQVAIGLAAPEIQCKLDMDIINGTYTLSNGTSKGSIVTYSCPAGQYPHPAYTRECLYSGRWSNYREKAVCKDVRCPRPVTFEGGLYYPNKRFYNIGDVLTFECWDGFKMRGSAIRTCQENAKWSGTTAICDDFTGDCPNPGIPIGSTKSGNFYTVESKVFYECQPGQKMFGSKMRECMENHQWSGAEPQCRMWYTYDTAEEVARGFFTTLSANMDGIDPNKGDDEISDRTINIVQGGLMNIFIVLDASHSVKKKDFNAAKESCEELIEKISSFDITPRYAIISFAAKAVEIVALRDEDNIIPAEVITKLKKIDRSEHADKQGTNTRAALMAIYRMLIEQEDRDKENFMKTQNVIVLMTDGQFNMGGDPREAIKKIREVLNIGRREDPREDFLDVYVFGLGSGIDQQEINDLASKKNGEIHSFHLRNADTMKSAFHHMIDETGAMDMCGISIDHKKYENLDVDKRVSTPWIANIIITRPGAEETCKGSILSKYFILTAAHCFIPEDSTDIISVKIGADHYKVKDLKRHPQYDPASKQDKKIPKTFDYDMAVIELTKEIRFSNVSRPICIPCTKSTSWALKKPQEGVTCRDHLRTLLSEELVPAQFIAEEVPNNLFPLSVMIKQGPKRSACLEDAKLVKQFAEVADIRDVVTDQFLCTGGIEPVVDAITCQGDSGGPLLVPYRNGKRYIQVGIISWGTVIHCDKSKRKTTPVPKEARDFHFSLFDGLPWLEEVLQFQGIEFLP